MIQARFCWATQEDPTIVMISGRCCGYPGNPTIFMIAAGFCGYPGTPDRVDAMGEVCGYPGKLDRIYDSGQALWLPILKCLWPGLVGVAPGCGPTRSWARRSWARGFVDPRVGLIGLGWLSRWCAAFVGPYPWQAGHLEP